MSEEKKDLGQALLIKKNTAPVRHTESEVKETEKTEAAPQVKKKIIIKKKAKKFIASPK